MSENYCLGGEILWVDLDSRAIRTEPTAPYTESVLGGLGISVLRMLQSMDAGVAPFDPDCVLAFGAGALVGTIAPTASRLSINSLNPYNGGFASTSAGGFFTPELKYAGFDNVMVTGRAAKPVYLLIDDGHVSIEDAGFLWGKTTGETVDRLQRKHDDPRLEVLAIGPAGENRLKMAGVIVSRSRAAARSGLGAVMGAKNLKAIAVRGSGEIRVADPEGFVEAALEMSKIDAKTKTARKLRRFGSPVSFEKWNAQGAVPVRNFQRTQMEAARAANLHAEVLERDHIRRNFGCFACSTPCSQYLEIRQGPYKGTEGEKVECQNIWDFGAKLDIDSLPAVLKASQLCTEFGMDVSSTSGVIAWAIECFERGILGEADTGGLKLEWGDAAALITLIERLARQEDDFARLLGKGSRDAAAAIGRGSERFAIHVKGQELAEELRPFKGWALGVAVAERAGTHTQGAPLTERMEMSPAQSEKLFSVSTAAEPGTYEGKASLIAYYQRFHAILEGLGVCFFSSNWMGPQQLAPEQYLTLYNLGTGRDLSLEDFMAAGERIHTLQKLVNIKHADFSRADDYPPARFFEEPASGTQAGERLDRAAWSSLLDDYYDQHGWDRESGRPTPATLSALGLDALAPAGVGPGDD